jgi:hypothetical protein
MISHASEDDSFVDYLDEKMDRAGLGLDIFIDHKRNLVGDDAQRMIDEVKKSIIFIPVYSNFAIQIPFFINEVKTAMNTSTTNIFPIKLNCDDDKIPDDIKISFSGHDKVTGKLYSDFSNRSEWPLKTEELLKAITNKLTDLDLFRKDEFFYQDVEYIDKILTRDNPSPGEIKTMVDVFLRKEAYQYYFFKRLKRLSWLIYLKLYGYFDRNPWPIEVENQPGSYTMPRWRVLDYLEWCSTQITDQENITFGESLIDIVRSVSKYRDPNGKRNDNYITDWSFTKIMANLPDRYLNITDIELVEMYLESRWRNTLVGPEIGDHFLPALLNRHQKEKSTRLLEIVTAIKWRDEGGYVVPDSIIDTYWLNDLFEKNSAKLGDVCPLEAVETILSRIKEITEQKSSEFSTIEIAAIENHSQDDLHKGRFPNILVRAARDLLNNSITKDKNATLDLLTKLFQEKHPIFIRIALSIVSTNWKACSTLNTLFLNRHILNDYHIKHEVYVFLGNNFHSFADEEKETVIDWIESGPDKSDDDSYNEKQQAYWRQEWLSALLLSGYPRVTELYEKYKSITNIDPDHPGFNSWTEMGWGPDPSPISIDSLLQKSNISLAEYLISYKDTEKSWRSPSKEGLKHALSEAVKTHPEKFDIDLQPFLKVTIDYQYQIISGFRKAWEEKRDIDWEKITVFCIQLTEPREFWVKPQQDGEDIRRDILVGEIADLITDGTKDDSRAFPPKLLPQAEDLLLTLLERTESKLERTDDLLFEVLNSAKGRILTALVNYSLRVARLSASTTGVKWPEKIKSEFNKRLDRAIEPDLRYSLTLGRYLAYFFYLDKQWVINNINLIFPQNIDDHWQAAMEGYLLHGRVYSEIYDLLKSNGHYHKAITTSFRDKEAGTHLIEHLCIGYLLEKETLDDDTSPFFRILDRRNTETLTRIIWFFWSQREFLIYKDPGEMEIAQQEIKNKQITRILVVWRYMFGVLKSKATPTEDDQKLASELTKLTCYLSDLNNESFEWVTFSAKFVDKNHNSPFFIEYLLRLCATSPAQVGKTYISMLENSTPIFDQKNIISLVTKLFEYNQFDLANKICNIYGGRGVEFLRDIYESFNNH